MPTQGSPLDRPHGPRFVDIGANLVHESFDPDRDEVLARARDAGVETMLVTGTSARDSERALALANAHPGMLYSTAGVHPHEARHYDDAAERTLRRLLEHPRVRAVGECGLDYNRDFSPRSDQVRAFEAQLEIAVDLGRPLFLHCRDAETDFHRILAQVRDRIGAAVVHCFTGSAAALDRSLELGLHVGVTGWICDERRGTELRTLVARVPRGRLLLETDSPYLLPRSLPHKPRRHRNEPAFLRHVAEVVATLRGESLEDLAEHTTKAAREFFALPEEV